MPRFADLQNRSTTQDVFPAGPSASEEMMVNDVRSQLSPAQVVEQKFVGVLRCNAAFSLRDKVASGCKTTKQFAGRTNKPR